jgi:hypothetical protein
MDAAPENRPKARRTRRPHRRPASPTPQALRQEMGRDHRRPHAHHRLLRDERDVRPFDDDGYLSLADGSRT